MPGCRSSCFEPFLILSKDPDLRDRASTSLRRHGLIAGQTADSSVAVGSEKPTTPCKCCTSITGRWWIWRRRRGTGRSAPRVYCRALGLAAENLVKAAEATAPDLSIIRGVSPAPMEWCGLAVAGQNYSRVLGRWEALRTMLRCNNGSVALQFLIAQCLS